MTKKDDAIAATTGVDSMLRARTPLALGFSATAYLHDAMQQMAPALLPKIEIFQTSIQPLDRGALDLLGAGEATPDQYGIQTPLSPGQYQVVVKGEVHEREVEAERSHQERLAEIPVKGELKNMVIRLLIVAVIGFILGRFA